MNKILLALMAITLVVMHGRVQAAPADGREYRQVAGGVVAGPAQKIEVIEFFAYSCPHCRNIDPLLDQWARSNAGRVALRRVHVNTANSFALHQKLFFTLHKMSGGDTHGQRVFDAFHEDRNYLTSERGIATFISDLGMDKAVFLANFRSPSIEQETQAAQQLQTKFGITRWPAFVVNQRFVTEPEMAASGAADRSEANANALTLQTIDHLVGRSAPSGKRP